MPITHNLDSLTKRLNIIEKAYLPQAAKAALKSFGFEARDILKKEMNVKTDLMVQTFGFLQEVKE